MPAGDLALRMLITADSTGAVAAVGLVGTHLLGLSSIFPGLKNGLGNISFGLRNLGTSGTIGMDALKQGAVQAGNSFFKLGLALASIGAVAAIAIGGLAVHAAADFQQGLNRLRTGAGDTQDSFASLSKGILDVSVATGQMTGPLTNAMYLILSSGQRGAQAFDTLKVAAEGAVIEQANVVDVANVVSGAMHNFGTRVFSASDYMNGLVKAVSLGKISLQDLSTSMGPLEPLAHQLGISYNDLSAAMTTQTNAMIPAARAATSLRFMMQSLEVPTKKAKDAMASMGLDSIKVGEEMKKSLPGALQMVYDAAKKAGPEGSVPFNRAFSDMIGGQRSLSAALALTGTHMKDFAGNSRAIADAMKGGKEGVVGWSIAQGNFNVQMDRAKAAVQATLITIGTALLPVLTKFLAYIAPIIVSFGQWLVSSGALKGAINLLVGVITTMVTVISSVATFLQHNALAMALFKAALIVLAAIIATLMVAALVAWAIAAWSAAVAMIALTWPVLAVLAVIILVVAGIILAIKHWGAIMDWITGKTEQLRIAHEQKMVQMRIASDNQTAKMAQHSIDNLEVQRTGMLKKLAETTDPMERNWLIFHLKMNATQIKAQGARLQLAEQDKKKQLAKQKELHDQMLEAQKWFGARFLDMVIVWTGNVFSAIGTWAHNLLPLIGGVFSALGTKVHEILGDIGSFIGGVFSGLGSFIRDKLTAIKNTVGGIFSAIGTFVRDRLTDIKNFVGNIFSAIGTKIHDALIGIATFFINKWNDLVSFVKSIPGKIGQALANLGTVLLAPFKWFYDHNWYVKAAVDAIHTTLTNLKNLVGNIFSAIGTFIHDKLTWIKDTVGTIFSAIGTKAHDFITGVKNTVGGGFDWLGTHVHEAMTGMKNTTGNAFDGIGSHARSFATGTKNTVGSAFDWIGSHTHSVMSTMGSFIGSKMSDIGSTFRNALTNIKNTFGNIFDQIGTAVHSKLTGLWNWITGFVSGWPAQAFQWGANLIQGLINGIGSMFSNLGSMLHNIAGMIGNFLGFHSPTKEGPGREADKWAPAFINMYVAGLKAGIPQVNAAFATLVTPTTARANNAFALQGGGSSSAGGGYGVMNLSIKFDTREVAEAVGVRMAKEVRINGRRNV